MSQTSFDLLGWGFRSSQCPQKLDIAGLVYYPQSGAETFPRMVVLVLALALLALLLRVLLVLVSEDIKGTLMKVPYVI
jgi:hypothetical protein